MMTTKLLKFLTEIVVILTSIVITTIQTNIVKAETPVTMELPMNLDDFEWNYTVNNKLKSKSKITQKAIENVYKPYAIDTTTSKLTKYAILTDSGKFKMTQNIIPKQSPITIISKSMNILLNCNHVTAAFVAKYRGDIIAIPKVAVGKNISDRNEMYKEVPSLFNDIMYSLNIKAITSSENIKMIKHVYNNDLHNNKNYIYRLSTITIANTTYGIVSDSGNVTGLANILPAGSNVSIVSQIVFPFSSNHIRVNGYLAVHDKEFIVIPQNSVSISNTPPTVQNIEDYLHQIQECKKTWHKTFIAIMLLGILIIIISLAKFPNKRNSINDSFDLNNKSKPKLHNINNTLLDSNLDSKEFLNAKDTFTSYDKKNNNVY